MGDIGKDNCQPPIEITTRLYHRHHAHPKTDTSLFGQEAHAHQSSLEIIAMRYWGHCHLQHSFLRDHLIKQTSDILATAATRYSFITSSKRKYPQTPCSQAHPITCTAPWGCWETIRELLPPGPAHPNLYFRSLTIANPCLIEHMY